MMNRFSALIFVLMCSLSALAQDLTVKSFEEKTMDLSAFTMVRLDNNGVPCALVKVQLPCEGAIFDDSMVVGKDSIRFYVNEYWVYMAQGSKRLKVSIPGYHTVQVNFSDYGITSLKSKTTYELVIDTPANTSQKVQKFNIKVSPLDAMVIIDGQQIEGLVNGKLSMNLQVGNHSFSVVKEGYVVQSGTICLTESAPGKLVVELDPKVSSHTEGSHQAAGEENNSSDMNSRVSSSSQSAQNVTQHHKMTGYVVRDGTKYPIELQFYEKNGQIDRCIYKNVTFGGKLNLVGQHYNGTYKFSGKDGTGGFRIEVESSGGNNYDGYFVTRKDSLRTHLKLEE